MGIWSESKLELSAWRNQSDAFDLNVEPQELGSYRDTRGLGFPKESRIYAIHLRKVFRGKRGEVHAAADNIRKASTRFVENAPYIF
jgi:hypothetical protein